MLYCLRESEVHENNGIAIHGHFTLWPSVERTKDSTNLIGGKQSFVHWVFTLKANIHRPPKCLYGSTSWEFWHLLRVCLVNKSLSTILVETQILFREQTFLSKFTQNPQFVYFSRLIFCPLKENLSKVLSTQWPYYKESLNNIHNKQFKEPLIVKTNYG